MTKTSVLLAATMMISTPAWGSDKTDFTGQKPTSSQLIEALKAETAPASGGFKTRGFTMRSGGARGLGVEATQVKAAPPKAVNLTVRFELGSARLTADARDTLSQLGAAMTSDALAANRFKIVGHTDATGGRDYNYNLSMDRAEAVTLYLVRNFDIAQDRLSAQGMGEDDLLDYGDPGSAKNRRVEVVNVGLN